MRYARLFSQLPPESRMMEKLSPLKDWNWDREVQSRIIAKLDIISCQLGNMMKKKGAKPMKPDEQFQPDYVKKGKNKLQKEHRKQSEVSAEDMEDIKDFWQQRNGAKVI